jgi:hypothetical protein
MFERISPGCGPPAGGDGKIYGWIDPYNLYFDQGLSTTIDHVIGHYGVVGSLSAASNNTLPNGDLPIYGVYGWGQQILSHRNLQAAVSLVRDPDYVSLSGSYGFWSGSIQYVPSSGNWYITPIVGGVGTPSLSITAGYLNSAGVNPDVFVSEWGGNACAFGGAGG